MKQAECESTQAARWAKDPKGNAEKECWRSEQKVMFMEDRRAQKIKHADSLPPPKKRPCYIHELPRPPKYIDGW